MKVQILTDDGKVLETIEEVHVHLKSQYGMGKLLDKLLHVYKNKYLTYILIEIYNILIYINNN